MIEEVERTFTVTPRCGHTQLIDREVPPRYGEAFYCEECKAATKHVRVVDWEAVKPPAYTPPMPEPNPLLLDPHVLPPEVGPPTPGDHEDAERLAAAYPPPEPPQEKKAPKLRTEVKEIPQRILDACGGDLEQARRVVSAIAPAVRAVTLARQNEESLQVTLDVTRTIFNRHLSILAARADTPLKPLLRTIEAEILNERTRRNRG